MSYTIRTGPIKYLNRKKTRHLSFGHQANKGDSEFNMGNLEVFNSVSDHMIARIPEISYLLSSIFMIFASDYIIGSLLIKRLRRMGFVTRTSLFLLFGLLILPGMTALGALWLRNLVLNPFQDRIILVLVICFFLTGIFLSIRYNMKIKLKVR